MNMVKNRFAADEKRTELEFSEIEIENSQN